MTRKINIFGKFCRLCMQENKGITYPVFGKYSDMIIRDMIELCYDIIITPKSPLQTICERCLAKLDVSHSIRIDIDNVNLMYNKMILDLKIKSEEEHYEIISTAEVDHDNAGSTGLVQNDADLVHPEDDNIPEVITNPHNINNIPIRTYHNPKKKPNINCSICGDKLQPGESDSCTACDNLIKEEIAENGPDALIKQKTVERKPKSKYQNCYICNKRVTAGRFFDHHLSSHSDIELKCQLCAKDENEVVFQTIKSLNHHLMFHGATRQYKCSICFKRFHILRALKNHEEMHEIDNLAKLPYPFPKPPPPLPVAPESIMTPCTYCGKLYKGKRNLKQHERRHTLEKSITCELCAKVCVHITHYKRHMLMHTGERPFVCEVCGKGYVSKSKLNEHLRIHTGSKPYKCQHCNRNFRTYQWFTKHRRGDICRAAQVLQCCFICNFSVEELSDYIQHMKQQHSIIDQLFKCRYCEEKFTEYQQKRQHEKQHSKKHATSKLIDHLLHVCQICEKACATAQSLQQHKITHSDERPFSCTSCSQTFKISAAFKRHERTHLEIRDYKCDICHKLFMQKTHMETHRRIHTDQKPLFVCETSGMTFSDKSTAIKHKKRHT